MMKMKHFLNTFIRLLNSFVLAGCIYSITYTFIQYFCSYLGLQLWKAEFNLVTNMITYPLLLLIFIIIVILHFYKHIFSFLSHFQALLCFAFAVIITDYIPFQYLNQFYQNIDDILGKAHVLYPITENALVLFFNSSILYFIFLIFYFMLLPYLKIKA